MGNIGIRKPTTCQKLPRRPSTRTRNGSRRPTFGKDSTAALNRSCARPSNHGLILRRNTSPRGGTLLEVMVVWFHNIPGVSNLEATAVQQVQRLLDCTHLAAWRYAHWTSATSPTEGI
ncbi:hypothetical protein AB1N83_006485 [Pleurotus pulmonarius]